MFLTGRDRIHLPRHFLPVAAAVSFCLFTCLECYALDPSRSLFQYNCQTWTRQTGLPANGINAIAQAGDGYIWLGTAHGLVSFDGIEFKSPDLKQVSRLRSTVVRGLSSSRRGGLWFGLERGAFGFWDGDSVSLLAREEWGGKTLSVQSIFEATSGDVWVGAETELGRLTPSGQYQELLTGAVAKDRYDITALCEGSEGRIWFGSVQRGLFSWQKGKIAHYPEPDLDKLTIRAVAEDRQGRIWVGSEKGLLCYDRNHRRMPLPYPWYETRALLVDNHGVVWVGSSGGGLVRYRPDAFTTMTNHETLPSDAGARLASTNGLADDFVNGLAEDREGNIWVGTRNGLSELSDVKLPTFGKYEGVAGEVYVSVSPSRQGGVWVATDAGLCYFDHRDGRNSATYSTRAGLKDPYLTRAFEARNGDVYLINGSKDVEVFSHGKVAARYPNGPWPTAFAEDARSVVVSINAELFRVSAQELVPYTFTNGQKPDLEWVFNMATGSDGAIWIASDVGLCRVKDGNWTLWGKREGLADAKVLWVYPDTDGTVWAGLESGIARLKNGQIRNIGRAAGLFGQNIYAIIPDDAGAFWVDSNLGIFRVRRKSLDDFCDGNASEVDCTPFDGLNAVKSDDKNQQKQSGCKTADGRIWFPTTQGIVMIDPDRITTNLVPPQIHISLVRANGRDVVGVDQAQVRPGKGELEVDYAALSYVAPQKVRYRYQLDGYDKTWVEAGGRRSAFYTNLKPGQYKFNVIACNADGVWTRSGASFQVEFLPHFYQTSWFYGLIGLSATALLLGIYAGRVQRLNRKQQEIQKAHDLLEVKVEERTAELTAEISQRKQMQYALELQKKRLENEIEERKKIEEEMARIHKQLVDASRMAGQAEVASSVLHNVGNVLNSVNVSAELMVERLSHSKVGNIGRIAEMLESHKGNLAEYLSQERRAEKIIEYVKELARILGAEREKMLGDVRRLTGNIDHIKHIVAMQQSYARVHAVLDAQSIPALVEDALRMNENALARLSVAVVRKFDPLPDMMIDRHKVLQVLVNLISNAKYALSESRTDAARVLTVGIHANGDDNLRIVVQDNGMGIAPENLTRIFSHGFTTRPDGHGFGLHSGFLAAKEMGGTLKVESEGLGKGATFTLELPYRTAEPLPAPALPPDPPLPELS